MTANERWAEALAAWAIPDEILAGAPESPWGFPSNVFVDIARGAVADPLTPTHDRVAEALPDGGTVLDVGCGAGAASLPVAPPAGRIVAVDQDLAMLDAMRSVGGDRVEIDVVAGLWPDVRDQVPVVDVAVCANVAYNVANLGAFVTALTDVARRRAVLELTGVHPQQPMSPLWRHFWGIDRPTDPRAGDAIDVVHEATGAEVEAHRWERARPYLGYDHADHERVAWTRRRLCLTPAADAELAEQLQRVDTPAPTSMVTLWWPGRAGPEPARSGEVHALGQRQVG